MLTFFFPTSAISVGVVGGLTRYLTNVTMVNNDQRDLNDYPCCVRVSKQENVLIILKISTFIHPVFED